MREEINEPRHWRRPIRGISAVEAAWPKRRRTILPLAAEAVDAAFEEEAANPGSLHRPIPHVSPSTNVHQDDASGSQMDIVQGLSSQLALLEAQRAELQRLLKQAVEGRN